MAKKILIALLVLCMTFSLASCMSEESSSDYTKGSVTDNVYVNEWANIKFVLDDTTWKQGSASDYQSYENDTTDCGLIAGLATEGRQLAIAFETNPAGLVSEETYLTNVKTGMTSASTGYTFGEFYNKTIAGKQYLGVDATLTQNGVSVYQAFYTTRHDGKFISIVVTSITDRNEISSVLDKITTVE